MSLPASPNRFFGPVLLSLILPLGNLIGAVMPQDTWTHYGKKLQVPDAIQKKGVAASNNAIYVGVSPDTITTATTSIQKYAVDGTFASTLPATFTDVTGMACDTTGNLYVFDRGQASLKAYNPSGTLLWSSGSPGNGPGQFSTTASAYWQSTALAVDESNRIHVLDVGNSRVHVFDANGNFVNQWGTPGTSGGQLQAPFGIAARNGSVVVVDTPSGNRQRLQKFTESGDFLQSVGWPTLPNFVITNERFALSPDGLLFVGTSGVGNVSNPLYDLSLTKLGNVPISIPGGIGTRLGATFTPSGDIWSVSGANVLCFERRHSSTDNPLVRNAIPQPEVTRVAQRAASTLLDIDYCVHDTDSATVDVAALAFVDGEDTLAKVLKLSTLVEGTAANVGPGQATNVTKRLTWNATTDWTTQFGEVQIEVLAKDQRDLLGIHWITVPGTTSFVASAKPVEDADLLSLWYWLIAKSDPAISLVSGSVKGVGGAYNGQTLANGTTTTAAGRQFLYERLGVRAITAGELTTLQAGNYGFSSSSASTVVRP